MIPETLAQQKCRCGWLLPRQTAVEQIRGGDTIADVRIVVICPVCGRRLAADADHWQVATVTLALRWALAELARKLGLPHK